MSRRDLPMPFPITVTKAESAALVLPAIGGTGRLSTS